MNYKAKLHKINTFIFDFDGVLSDGKVITLPDGDQLRATNVKDGYALRYALERDYRVAIISGGYSDTMKHRYKTFPNIQIYLSVANKIEIYEQLLKTWQIQDENVLYMGDDIPDMPVMARVGVKTCPADAAVEIKNMADYISLYKGGEGCVRDVIEQTLKLQGRWLDSAAHLW